MSKSDSAFKLLYTEMFNQGGNFHAVKEALKKPIKCYVKESFPHFLISDGYFYVNCYFTNDAEKEFRNKFSNQNMVDLHDKVIVLNKWHLEMRKVNSAEVFTSYLNLEVRMVVSSFKVMLQEKINKVRYPINLFRDDEMKTIIQHYHQSSLAVRTTNAN